MGLSRISPKKESCAADFFHFFFQNIRNTRRFIVMREYFVFGCAILGSICELSALFVSNVNIIVLYDI